MNSQLSRVVLLGSNGFVGKNLQRSFKDSGIKILPLSTRDLDLTRPESVDLLTQKIHPEDSVVFLSALTPDRGRDHRTMLANLEMARSFIDAIEKAPCAHITYISSDAVYSDNATHIDETTPCDPSGLYGIMHIAREKMLLEAASRIKIPLMRVRPCAVYGSGDTHNSYGPNRFVKTAREAGKISLSGEGEDTRDHLYIDDLCRLLTRVIVERSVGVLNAVSGLAVPFMTVAKTICELSDNEVQIECSPRQNPVSYRAFDNIEVFRRFPDFTFTRLEEGIKNYLSSMKNPAAGEILK